MGFWETMKEQIRELESAKTADDVIRILDPAKDPLNGSTAGDAWFGGSGGDDSVYGALRAAGWRTVWCEAAYYYCVEAPNGDRITYVEGDIYRGDSRS